MAINILTPFGTAQILGGLSVQGEGPRTAPLVPPAPASVTAVPDAPLAASAGPGAGPGSEMSINVKPVTVNPDAPLPRKANDVVSFFQEKGWSKQASMALTARVLQESGIDPDSTGDQGTAYGIMHWRKDRRERVETEVEKGKKGGIKSVLMTQLEFVDWELNNTEKVAGATLKAAKNMDEALFAVYGYARPQAPFSQEKVYMEQRLEEAGVGRHSGIEQSRNLISISRGRALTDEDYEQLNPEFAQRLKGAIAAAEKATGEKALVTSAKRSRAQQEDIWQRSQGGRLFAAAPPGRSRHETGEAVDLPRGKVRDWLRAHASEFGLEILRRKKTGEPFDYPHIQMVR